jgi:hypothetical protein
MDFNRDSLRAVGDYIAQFCALLGPGMMILDVSFHKGYFSGNIQNVYEVILLIFWSLLFSSPTYMTTALLGIWMDPTVKLDDNQGDAPIFESGLPLTVLSMLVIYLMYKALWFFDSFHSVIQYGISQNVIITIASLVLTVLFMVPLGKLYYALFSKVFRFISIRAKGSEKEVKGKVTKAA